MSLADSLARAFTFLMRVSSICILLVVAAFHLLKAGAGYGQTTENTFVDIEAQHAPLRSIISELEAKTNFLFVFPPELLENKRGSIRSESKSVKEVLMDILPAQGLAYREHGTNVVVYEAKVSAHSVEIIKGTVKDTDGIPMPGVNVLVKSSTIGTVTDTNGQFQISAPAGTETFVFSFIGYKTIEVQLNGQTEINVVMAQDLTTLQEVQINGGYYTTTNLKKTGSIARITEKEIGNQPVTSPLLSLQGRVPGVEISPFSGLPGSAVNIKIRGQNSIRSWEQDGIDGGQPLYIIDGVPVDPTPVSTANTSVALRGFDPLSTINPANIESIEILKDADATAIYGSRGANGVIVITTKNKKSAEGLSVDVNYYRGVGDISSKVDLLNTEEYLGMVREAIENDGPIAQNAYNDPFRGPALFPSLLLWDTTRNTDWQDVLMGGKSDVSDIRFNLTAGSGTTTFGFGGSYHKESLVYPGNFGLRRGNGLLTMNHISTDGRFSVNLSVNYGANSNELFNSSDLEISVLSLPPDAPRLYTDDGSLNWERRPAGISGAGRNSWINPMSYLRITQRSKTYNLIANAVLSYEIVKGLRFKTNLGYSKLDNSETINVPISSINPYGFDQKVGTSTVSTENRISWIIEPQLNYAFDFGKHGFTALVGSTWQEVGSEVGRFIGTGYNSDALLGTLSAAADITNTGVVGEYRYASAFARIGYNYADKYLLNITGRRDGSSKFGPNYLYGNFGSVGAGWVFSNENLFEGAYSILSYGKLRGSYGETGNDQIGDSNYLKRYTAGQNTYHGVTTLVPHSLFNPDYAWEVTKKLEFALELGLFRNVITSEIAWFRNRSSNQLVNYTLPSTTGFSSVLSNFGATIENSGFELSLTSRNVNNGKFVWTSSFNISRPQNRLVSFDGIEETAYNNLLKVGESLSVQRGFVYKNVNPQTGLYEFYDMDSDGAITDFDRQFIGSLDVDYYGGLSNSFSYKRIEFSFLIQFSNRQSRTILSGSTAPGAAVNQPVQVLDRWRNEGDITDVQKFTTGRNLEATEAYQRWRESDVSLGEVSFVRLKTLTLNYRLPKFLTDKLSVRNFDVFIQGQNLFTITNYDGWDPETLNGVPPLRIVSGGVNIKI